MVSEEKKKKAIKIYKRFTKMVESGKPKMEAYRKLAKDYEMSVEGIRRAVLSGSDYSRKPAKPLTDKDLSPYK